MLTLKIFEFDTLWEWFWGTFCHFLTPIPFRSWLTIFMFWNITGQSMVEIWKWSSFCGNGRQQCEGWRRSTCTETKSEEAVASLASMVVMPLISFVPFRLGQGLYKFLSLQKYSLYNSFTPWKCYPLHSAALQHKLWLCYVDDTFVIWHHSQDELRNFKEHLNSQTPSIQFTCEEESEKKSHSLTQ